MANRQKKWRLLLSVAMFALAFMPITDLHALDIAFHGDTLTLEVRKVPLQKILRQLAKKGVRVRIDPGINPEITGSYKNREIQDVLKSLFKGLSYTLVWESMKGPAGPMHRLEEIQVFVEGQKDRMSLLPGRKILDIGVDPDTGDLFVKDEVIVRFTPGLTEKQVNKILEAVGGAIVEGDPATGTYRIALPEGSDVLAARNILEKNPLVDHSEPNYAYPTFAPGRHTLRKMPPIGFTHSPAPEGSVPVAVLDTGMDWDSVPGVQVVASLDAVSPGQLVTDAKGHGTQMALIASGLVKPHGATKDFAETNPLIPIRAFDDNGLTSTFTIMESLNFAVEKGARVINLSWGTETQSQFLESALENVQKQGVILVAAAGNEPTENKVYPAAYESVIAVGALNPEGKDWEKTSQGKYVLLEAPGFANLPVGYGAAPGTYAGTSISSAYVSAIIANELSKNPQATREQIYKAVASHF